MRGIQGGVIEVITDGKSRYFEPKGCDRIRLLWAFRNFSRLPEPVLSAKQREVVERLCRSPEVAFRPAKMVIIGAVERYSPRPRKPPQSERLIPASTAAAQQVAGGKRAAAGARTSPTPAVPPLPAEIASGSGLAPPKVPGRHVKTGKLVLVPSASGKSKRPKRNWAIRIAYAWVPLAAVMVMGVAWLLHSGKEPTPGIGRGSLLQPAFPAVNESAIHEDDRTQLPAGILSEPAASQPAPVKVARPEPGSASAPPSPPPLPAASVGHTKPPVEAVLDAPLPQLETDADVVLNSQSARRPSRWFYPDAPAAAHFPGKVVLKATIGPGGGVENVIAMGGDPRIAAAAAAAMKHWRYDPPGGEFETEVMFNFVSPDVTTVKFLGEREIR